MSGLESFWRQQMEDERMRRSLEILARARMARNDGYFTDEDIADMTYEFGLSTHRKPHSNTEPT